MPSPSKKGISGSANVRPTIHKSSVSSPSFVVQKTQAVTFGNDPHSTSWSTRSEVVDMRPPLKRARVSGKDDHNVEKDMDALDTSYDASQVSCQTN